MPNMFITPEWIMRDTLTNIGIRPALAFHPDAFSMVMAPLAFEGVKLSVVCAEEAATFDPLDPCLLLTLGAAAIIASPRKISRRTLLGLSWKRRDEK